MKLLGFKPMPWQEQVCEVAFEVDDNGDLVYREVVLIVPRQAGKTALQLAVVVHRAWMFEERQLSFYTAQTRNDARAKFVNDDLPRLKESAFSSVCKSILAPGNEGLLWQNGSRHRVVAPTKKAGHGSSTDLAVLDEAFAFVDDSLEQGFKPAQVTRKSAQTWIMSAAGDETSFYLQAKRDLGRERTKQGANTGSCYFEWSSELEASDPAVTEPETWRKVHPAIGYTIEARTIEADLATMERDEFCRAYLAIWPKGNSANRVISSERWATCLDDSSFIPDGERLCFTFEVARDRSTACIAVAGKRADGSYHVEIVDRRAHTEWLPERFVDILSNNKDCVWALDNFGPTATLFPEVLKLIDERKLVSQVGIGQLYGSTDVMKSAQFFTDCAMQHRLRHRGQSSLDVAVSVAEKREYGNTWTWKASEIADMSPLRAASLALWGLYSIPVAKKQGWLIA